MIGGGEGALNEDEACKQFQSSEIWEVAFEILAEERRISDKQL